MRQSGRAPRLNFSFLGCPGFEHVDEFELGSLREDGELTEALILADIPHTNEAHLHTLLEGWPISEVLAKLTEGVQAVLFEVALPFT